MTSAPEPLAPTVHVGGLWTVGPDLVMVRPATGPDRTRWRLPGGAVRAGETLAEAVVRTVEADTAAVALCGPFVGWGEVVDEDLHVLTMYFGVVVLEPPEVDRRTGAISAGPSGGEVRCVPDWQVSELPVVPGLAELLSDQGLIDLVV